MTVHREAVAIGLDTRRRDSLVEYRKLTLLLTKSL